MFDQDMWLYYTCLKQPSFSSVFFRFSLTMLTMYEKNVCLVCMASIKILKQLLFVFVKICFASIRFEFRSSYQRCSIKKVVFRNIEIFTVTAKFNLLLNRQLLLIIKTMFVNKYFDSKAKKNQKNQKDWLRVQFTGI